MFSHQTSLQKFQQCLTAHCKYLFFPSLVIVNGGGGMKGNMRVVLWRLFIRPVCPVLVLRNAFPLLQCWSSSQTGQVQYNNCIHKWFWTLQQTHLLLQRQINSSSLYQTVNNKSCFLWGYSRFQGINKHFGGTFRIVYCVYFTFQHAYMFTNSILTVQMWMRNILVIPKEINNINTNITNSMKWPAFLPCCLFSFPEIVMFILICYPHCCL